MSLCTLCASVLLLYSRHLCSVAFGRYCSADACARSHRVYGAHCTTFAVLHHQVFVCGAALLVVLRTALCVPRRTAVVGSGQRAAGSGTSAMYCLSACGQSAVELVLCTAVELLQHSALPPGGSGQRGSCNTLPHCLGALGSGTPAFAMPHC